MGPRVPYDSRLLGERGHRRISRTRGEWGTCGAAALASLLMLIGALSLGGAGAVSRLNVQVDSLHAQALNLLPPGGDFPTYLGNIERTSSSASEQLINLTTAPSLHLLWNYTTKDPVQSQPVEQNGTVYFGSTTGYEYAVHATNGTLEWKTFLGQARNDTTCASIQGVTSTATLAGNNLYVDGGYPYFYALNSSTGAIEWSAPIGNGTSTQGYYDWSSPLIYNGNAYVGISSQCDKPLVRAGLDEFSLTTHAIDGYLETSVPKPNGSSIWGSPSVNPATNTIYVTTGNQYGSKPTTYSESVLAINATTLAVVAKWQVPKAQEVGDSDFGVTPTLFTPAGGYPMVTAANKNGILYAFYQSNLTLAWEQRICCLNSTQDEHISTSWGGGHVYAVSSITTIGGVTYNSSVRAFNPLTGAMIWQDGFNESAFYGYAAPLYVNGLLVVADEDALIVLNATSGSTVYQDAVAGTIVAAASIARGEIYAGTANGKVSGHVYAFDLTLNSSATQTNPEGTAPLVDSFRVTGSGGLPPYSYAWNFGDGGTSNQRAPSHTFADVGTYNVTVTVTDLAGNVSTTHMTVHVYTGFTVTFTEAGLDPGANWSVTLGGTLESSSSTNLSFFEPNGTYAFTVGVESNFSASPSAGVLTVNGTNQAVLVNFTREFSIGFTERGLPTGTPWNVTVGLLTSSSITSSIIFQEPNGTYAYMIGEVPGWQTKDAGTVRVAGAEVNVNLTFTQVTYEVLFKETGLPSGTNWSIEIGSTIKSSTKGFIDFHLPNGTYAYSVGEIQGYSSNSTGSFVIAGAGLTLQVHFRPVTYEVNFTESGLPADTKWEVTIDSTTHSTTGTTISFRLANGTYSYSVTTANGEYTANAGNLSVAGAPVGISVTFVAQSPSAPAMVPISRKVESGPPQTIAAFFHSPRK